MLPAAIGSQVGGSIVRPAGYCGNIALKPGKGAINRGERQTSSQSVHGVHANAVEDMWRVAAEIARRAGGDPGHRGLAGPAEPPPAAKPGRLLAIEGAGWPMLDDATKDAFRRLLEVVAAAGVAVLRPEDNPALAALDRELMAASAGLLRHHRLGKPLAAPRARGYGAGRDQLPRPPVAGGRRGDDRGGLP